MAMYNEHVGPVVCEELLRRLPMPNRPKTGPYNRILPNGTECMIGVERIWARSNGKPDSVAIDLGGEKPFILWR